MADTKEEIIALEASCKKAFADEGYGDAKAWANGEAYKLFRDGFYAARRVLKESTPPADAALADVLRLIDEQFGHAADVGATYIAFTQEETKRIAAALRARAVPEGFVMVPVEPTSAMVTAGADQVSDYYDDGNDQYHREIARFGYRAMLAASKEAK